VRPLNRIVTAGCVALGAFAAAAAAPPSGASSAPAPAGASAWKLPQPISLALAPLHVAPDARYVAFAALAENGTAANPTWCLLNTVTGEVRADLDILPEYLRPRGRAQVTSVAFAPDGRYFFAAVGYPGIDGAAGYVVDLRARTARKVAAGPHFVAGVWGGADLLVSFPYLGQVGRVERLAPGDKAAAKLGACGVILAADAAGRTLVVAGDANDPNRPIADTAVRGASWRVVTPAGALVRAGAPVREGYGDFRLSPGGKHLACSLTRRVVAGPADRPVSRREVRTLVVPLPAGATRTLGEDARPIAATDAGDVIAVAWSDRMPLVASAAVKFWPAGGGQPRTLVEKASPFALPAVAGGKVFYFVPTDTPTEGREIRWSPVGAGR